MGNVLFRVGMKMAILPVDADLLVQRGSVNLLGPKASLKGRVKATVFFVLIIFE
jgi:hypothetical protein